MTRRYHWQDSSARLPRRGPCQARLGVPVAAAPRRQKPPDWERSSREREPRPLELALLHLRKEVATLDVIVRTVGRECRVIALARFGFGLRRLGHVLLDQLCELFVFRLGHFGPPVRMINNQ